MTLRKALYIVIPGLLISYAVAKLVGNSLPEAVVTSDPVLKVIKESPGVIEAQIIFPKPECLSSSSGIKVQMGRLPLVAGSDQRLLPVYQMVLPGEARTLSLKILDARTALLPVDADLQRAPVDEVLTESDAAKPAVTAKTVPGRRTNAPAAPVRSDRWADLTPLGKHRGVPLSTLQFSPVRFDARTKSLTYLTSIKFRIEYPVQPGGGTTQSLLPGTVASLSGALHLPVSRTRGASQSAIASQFTGTQLKIYVSTRGLYHLSSDDLSAYGVNLSGVDPRTIRLENKGQELSIYVAGEADGRFDEGDYVEFWGDKLHGTSSTENPQIWSDLYTDINVYWLSWGGNLGSRLVEETGEIVEVDPLKMYRALSYPYWEHFELNQYFNRLSQVGPDSLKEHWYWDGGVSASQTKLYNCFLPYPDVNALIDVRVKVALQGLTYPDIFGLGGQHHGYVILNDQTSAALEAGSSGASWWVGQTGVVLYSEEGIGPGDVHHGNNNLSIFCPVDTPAGPNDTFLLNWFEVTYQRLYKAYNDQIRFKSPETAADTLVDYRVDGFTSPDISIYKLGQSKVINGSVIPYRANNTTFYQVHFQDRPYGDPEYVALTPSAKLQPDSAQVVEGNDLLAELSLGPPIKMLIVAHRDFENDAALDGLVQRRQAGLGRTELVFIDQVFNSFSDGIYNPQAIKDLLLALPEPPEFLLLVGDGSYDTRNIFGNGGNLMPAHYIQTKAYGSVASDFWYGLLDDDLIPDVAVGRISARDTEELDNYLAKLEEYDTNPSPGAWRNTHLFVSGTGGIENYTFLSVSQAVIDQLDDDVLPERLATDPTTNPFYGATTDLIDLLDQGALAVDYNGHGAGAVWSDNSLFRIDNLPQLTNFGKYPFVTNFTCFIGAFDALQDASTLGEEFIFVPQRGAIAVLGSTGLGWFLNGSYLQETLVGLIYDDQNLSLGQVVNAAKIAFYSYWGQQGQSVEAFDTIHLMNLLGDPSVKLAYSTRYSNPVQYSPQFSSSGDTITILVPGNYSGYQGMLRVYDSNNYPALQFGPLGGPPYETPLIPYADGLRAVFPLPALGDSSFLSGGSYRLSFWDAIGSTTYRGVAPLYLLDAYSDGSVIDSLSTDPEPVYARDTFTLKARILDAQGIASARMHYIIETNQGIPIVPHDSLPMSPAVNPPWYHTTTPMDSATYHYAPTDRIVAWVVVEDSSGNLTTSEDKNFPFLDSRANPVWVDSSLTMGMRENQAALIVQVKNLGQTTIDSLDVRFYLHDAALVPLGTAIIRNLPFNQTQEAYVISTLNPGWHNLEISINESGWGSFDSTALYQQQLLIDHFSISPSTGTADTLTLGDSFRLFIPPGGVSGQGVMIYRMRDDLSIPTMQNGLFFAMPDSNGSPSGLGFEVDLLGSIQIVGDSMKLSVDQQVQNDTLTDNSETYIHLQNGEQPFWQCLNSVVDTLSFTPPVKYRYSVSTHSTGLFTILQNGDHQGPKIELSVEGQIYTEGGYVPMQPKISALVQDVGGVNVKTSTYWISVDGVAVDTNLVSVGIENSGQVFNLSINPTFATGNHTVSVVAHDLAGNTGSASIQFTVVGQFKLDFIGNYPNPFNDKTYFSYRLTEQTTEPVRIRIYTVSGRLIRTLYSNSAQEINYGEIYWDGLDEDGSTIANGVYFYKIMARRGDTKIEKTMKMAKLRKG
ncbi:MAG: C25 family cysteine peptidase [bacterium]|nr:C25 family cysteine peptidase [bacterium]